MTGFKLPAQLRDKRVLAGLAGVVVLYLYLRRRSSGTGITAADTSTLPVDPTVPPAATGGVLGGDGTQVTGLDLQGLADVVQSSSDATAAALEGISSDLAGLQGAAADNAAQTQSSIEAAFQTSQAATQANTLATTTTPVGAAPFKTPITAAPATFTSPFTIAGGLDPAIAAAYAARNKTVAYNDTAPPRATLPPSPAPVNDSPAPAPPNYPIPAVSGTPAASIAVAAAPSLIASHLAHGRDPLD